MENEVQRGSTDEKPGIILISGISGSGKSSALKILEDKGFFCVDNMPMLLLPKFFEPGISARLKNIAFMVDIREKSLFDGGRDNPSIEGYIKFLRSKSSFFKYIFMEADDDVVIKRYSETRRVHPLPGNDLTAAIKKERGLLKYIKIYADIVLDTSSLTVHELKNALVSLLDGLSPDSAFFVRIISFGFKYGIPMEADSIFDARFLPNPFFVPSLKTFTGLDREVRDYMLSYPETDEFLNRVSDFLKFSLPLYKKENKSYFTIGIGCTGGIHRSVFIAGELKDRLRELNDEYSISYYHRDLYKLN